MPEDVKRPRSPVKRTQTARKARRTAEDADRDAADPIAIGLMIGIIAIIALLTLAMVFSIP